MKVHLFMERMNRRGFMKRFVVFAAVLILFGELAFGDELGSAGSKGPAKEKPIKIFVLAGDQNVLDQGMIEGQTDGVHDGFYLEASPSREELKKHVNVAVYEGAFSPVVDYDKLKPAVTGVVEIGEQRWKYKIPKGTGKELIPYTPFPELAQKDGYTTVLRGYVSVPYSGRYEFHPGKDEASCNVTTVEGREVYRKDAGRTNAVITPVELKLGQRYAFRTIFFGKPGHDFRLPLFNKPGCLETIVEEDAKYAFLKDQSGGWVKRDDVVLYDLHPIHNNTKTPGHFLQVGDVSYGGEKVRNAFGPELMFGHVLGNAIDEPVMVVRFATHGPRSLGHDYLPPSSGGKADLGGSWDVIHFNWGVWDANYREKSFKFYEGDGKHPTSYADWEKNLRTLVARLKKTGATLIWASVTPVWPGDPGKPPNADVKKYNAIAEKIMKENDVIIDDLYSEVLRQGYPKSDNVHSVGHLAPKVTRTILSALDGRKNPTKPLPRVLVIGDSISGGYIQEVTKSFDGKAVVFHNPGNAASSWNGLRNIDNWVDLKGYLQNGQEYLELVSGLRDVLENPGKAYPGYKGQGVELSGLVWFQGASDSGSPSMADAYGQNLVNLINDLRKEFKAPGLPVVVTALGYGGEKPLPNLQKVMAAQLAAGNPEKYPQFAGNVLSVDTRPFFYPPEKSPGGYSYIYFNNALSYLQIGEAMGRAMLDLLKNEKK